MKKDGAKTRGGELRMRVVLGTGGIHMEGGEMREGQDSRWVSRDGIGSGSEVFIELGGFIWRRIHAPLGSTPLRSNDAFPVRCAIQHGGLHGLARASSSGHHRRQGAPTFLALLILALLLVVVVPQPALFPPLLGFRTSPIG